MCLWVGRGSWGCCIDAGAGLVAENTARWRRDVVGLHCGIAVAVAAEAAFEVCHASATMVAVPHGVPIVWWIGVEVLLWASCAVWLVGDGVLAGLAAASSGWMVAASGKGRGRKSGGLQGFLRACDDNAGVGVWL